MNKLKEKIIDLLKNRELSVELAKRHDFTIFINHYRYVGVDDIDNGFTLKPKYEISKDEKETELLSRGGQCHVEIVDNESDREAKAISFCSLQDSYIRSVGIKYALRRALRNMLEEIKKQ